MLDGLERGGGVPAVARVGYQLQRGALPAVHALSDLAALQKRMGQLLEQLQQVEEAQGEVVLQDNPGDDSTALPPAARRLPWPPTTRRRRGSRQRLCGVALRT